MADWRSIPASGPDRERAADLLRAAHGDGRLAWPDYSTRLERLMSSTTHGEIHQVVADLVPEQGRQDTTNLGSPDGPATRAQSDPRAAGRTNRAAASSRRSGADRLASAAVLCGTLVPFTVGISGIPAVLLGHLARHRLKNGPGESNGNSAQLATAALVLGYFPIVAGLLVGLFLLTR